MILGEFNQEELDLMLIAHAKWLDNDGGKRIDLQDKDLSGLEINSILDKAIFNNCTLESCIIRDNTLNHATFRRCSFNNTVFRDSSGQKIDFYDCSFEKTQWLDIYYIDSKFTNSGGSIKAFNDSKFDKTLLFNCTFHKYNFNFSSFNTMSFDNSSFNECTLDDIVVATNTLKIKNTEFKNGSMKNFERNFVNHYQNVKFEEMVLDGLKFNGWNLSKRTNPDGKLFNCSLKNCDMNGADFTGIDFGKSDFDNTVFGATKFNESIIKECSFKEVTGGAYFVNCNAYKSIFDDAEMTTTRFDDSNFSRASFKNAHINNAFFINTDLSLSSLLNAVITGVGTTFENANLRGATYFGGETCDTTSIGTCNPI